MAEWIGKADFSLRFLAAMGTVLRPTPASHEIDVATFTYQKLFVNYTFLISIKFSVHSP